MPSKRSELEPPSTLVGVEVAERRQEVGTSADPSHCRSGLLLGGLAWALLVLP